MTDDTKSSTPDAQERTASLPLLADAPELLRVRILPAEFARLLGVSKQTVSRWIKEGKITVNPLDGRLDVQSAVQQVLRNTDPGRLRARVLRQAVEDVQQLRAAAALADERIASVNAELSEARKRIHYLDGYARNVDCMFDELKRLIIENEADLRATTDSAAWCARLENFDGMAAVICDQQAEANLVTDPSAEIDTLLASLDDDLAAMQMALDEDPPTPPD